MIYNIAMFNQNIIGRRVRPNRIGRRDSIVLVDNIFPVRAPLPIPICKDRISQMIKVQQTGMELFIKKNIDYGHAFDKYGIIGVLMRIEDKIHRMLTITDNGVNLVKDEGIRDTLIDLHNYAAMALIILDENEQKNNVIQ